MASMWTCIIFVLETNWGCSKESHPMLMSGYDGPVSSSSQDTLLHSKSEMAVKSKLKCTGECNNWCPNRYNQTRSQWSSAKDTFSCTEEEVLKVWILSDKVPSLMLYVLFGLVELNCVPWGRNLVESLSHSLPSTILPLKQENTSCRGLTIHSSCI